MSAALQLPDDRLIDSSVSALTGADASPTTTSAGLDPPTILTSAMSQAAAAAAAAFGCVDWFQYPATASPASLAH